VDVTLAELHLEAFLPADEASAEILRHRAQRVRPAELPADRPRPRSPQAIAQRCPNASGRSCRSSCIRPPDLGAVRADVGRDVGGCAPNAGHTNSPQPEQRFVRRSG
jgi:hypothetical protein